jgi:hypothetical protein
MQGFAFGIVNVPQIQLTVRGPGYKVRSIGAEGGTAQFGIALVEDAWIRVTGSSIPNLDQGVEISFVSESRLPPWTYHVKQATPVQTVAWGHLPVLIDVVD